MHRTKQWGGKRRDCSVRSGCPCQSRLFQLLYFYISWVLSISDTKFLTGCAKSPESRKRLFSWSSWAGYIVKQKAFISSMSLALHLERPAHCVWARGYYTLLFHKMCVELVCTPNWKYREKFIAHVILDYRRWLVYTCWVQIPQDAFISIGFRKFQRWINFRFVNTHFKNT